MTQPPRTLQDAICYFSDEQRCIDALVTMRWPDGVTCPTCGSDQVHYLATQRRWQCKTKHARRQFSIKVGTVMEDSPLPLNCEVAAGDLAVGELQERHLVLRVAPSAGRDAEDGVVHAAPDSVRHAA